MDTTDVNYNATWILLMYIALQHSNTDTTSNFHRNTRHTIDPTGYKFDNTSTELVYDTRVKYI